MALTQGSILVARSNPIGDPISTRLTSSLWNLELHLLLWVLRSRRLCMKLLVICSFALLTLFLSGCADKQKSAESFSLSQPAKNVSEESKAASGGGGKTTQTPQPIIAARSEVARGGGGGGRNTDSVIDDASSVSLASIGTVYAATESIDRKIIRNADLTLETESPTDGLRKITAAAESHGGFIVTSEFKQNPVA